MFDLLLLFLLLFIPTALISLARGVYCALFRPGLSWKRLTEIYRYAGPEPERLKASAFGLWPLSTPWSTYAAFMNDGLFLRIDGMSLSENAVLIPWDHVRVDVDLLWLVTLEVTPERTQFAFTRWFLGREVLKRIQAKR